MMTGPEHYEQAQQTIAALDTYIEALGGGEEGVDPVTITSWTQVAMVHLKAAEVAVAARNGQYTMQLLSWRKATGEA